MGSVRVLNASKSTILGVSVREARSFVARGRGLMMKSELDPGEGLVIDPCSSIHTCFMRFPIDVVYLNRDGVVLRTDRAMKPWRFGPIFTGSHWVIELPPGTIDQTGTQPGDQIRIEHWTGTNGAIGESS